MSWLQIGCPFCPSEINVPAMMADTEITCGRCGKSYVVPTPASPVLAPGPLAPVAILRTPGRGGNTATGMSPIARLPDPVGVNAAAPFDAGTLGPDPSTPAPPTRRGGAPFPWELSPAARASAAAIFGAESEPVPADDDLEAVERRMRLQYVRSLVRWTFFGFGMLLLIVLILFFLRR